MVWRAGGAYTLRCNAQAHIYAPARTASQQGQGKTATLKAKGPAWKIEFEVQQKCASGCLSATPLRRIAFLLDRPVQCSCANPFCSPCR